MHVCDVITSLWWSMQFSAADVTIATIVTIAQLPSLTIASIATIHLFYFLKLLLASQPLLPLQPYDGVSWEQTIALLGSASKTVSEALEM